MGVFDDYLTVKKSGHAIIKGGVRALILTPKG